MTASRHRLLISGLRRHPPPVALSDPQRLLPRGQAACLAAPYSVRAISRTMTPHPDLRQLPHEALPPLPLPPQELVLAGQQAASAHAPSHACALNALMHSCCLGARGKCIHSVIGPSRKHMPCSGNPEPVLAIIYCLCSGADEPPISGPSMLSSMHAGPRGATLTSSRMRAPAPLVVAVELPPPPSRRAARPRRQARPHT